MLDLRYGNIVRSSVVAILFAVRWATYGCPVGITALLSAVIWVVLWEQHHGHLETAHGVVLDVSWWPPKLGFITAQGTIGCNTHWQAHDWCWPRSCLAVMKQEKKKHFRLAESVTDTIWWVIPLTLWLNVFLWLVSASHTSEYACLSAVEVFKRFHAQTSAFVNSRFRWDFFLVSGGGVMVQLVCRVCKCREVYAQPLCFHSVRVQEGCQLLKTWNLVALQNVMPPCMNMREWPSDLRAWIILASCL